MKDVTIIIPVYGSWETLKVCLNSLIKYVPQENQVLVINDMGPEWRILENNIKLAIHEKPMFRYEKNQYNMGFVGTCNRAVKELDKTRNDILLLNSDTCVTENFLEEMVHVLYTNEKYGGVCPRSNNATLLTIPFNNGLKRDITADESYYIYNKIKSLLPKQTVIPTGVGFALLLKRELIDNFGLFDDVFAPGYHEENDFCQRINRYGYNIVMANHAYVYHFESKSFGEKKEALDKVHEKVLIKRYPYYHEIVSNYFYNDINVIDYYADMIVDTLYEKKKLLISLYELPSVHNGTTEYNLSFLSHFFERYKEKYDITIVINKVADSFFKISEKYPSVYYPDNIVGTFHLAFVPSQIYHMDHLLMLNQKCLKFIFCMQDIISIRTHHVLVQDEERKEVFRKSIRYCDGMTSISEFSLNDTKDFYFKEFQERDIDTVVIYHGTDNKKININEEHKFYIPYKQYFIVFGNFYEHKFLKETLPYIRESKYNFIIIGMPESKFYYKNIYGLKSGALEEKYINYLIKKSSAIFFPSLYEGFGLPILNAIQFRKKILVHENQLNIELRNYFSFFSENIYLYNLNQELEPCFDVIIEDDQCIIIENLVFERTWLDVVQETEQFIEKVLEESVDYQRLSDRWRDLKEFEKLNNYRNISMDKIDKNWLISCLQFKIKEYLKRKIPWLAKIKKK